MEAIATWEEFLCKCVFENVFHKKKLGVWSCALLHAESGVCLEAGGPACLSRTSIEHRPNICFTWFSVSLFSLCPSLYPHLCCSEQAACRSTATTLKTKQGNVCVCEAQVLHHFFLYKYHIIFKVYAVNSVCVSAAVFCYFFWLGGCC